jgi:hypothetical protein
MAEGAACLLDGNILLRLSKNDDPQQPIIANALKALNQPDTSDHVPLSQWIADLEWVPHLKQSTMAFEPE